MQSDYPPSSGKHETPFIRKRTDKGKFAYRYISSQIMISSPWISANRIAAMALLASLPLTACGKIWPAMESVSGDGNMTAESRQLATYHDIELDGSYDVVLSQDSSSTIRIETDKNLIPYIKTEVKGGKLTVSTEGNLQPSHRMKLFISTPAIDAVDLAGSSDVKASTPITSDKLKLALAGSGSYTLEVHAKKLSSEIAGSGKINLTGTAIDHTVDIAGSGDLTASNMPSESTKIDISGSGNADIYVTQKLNADISGSGNVRYHGSVNEVHTSVSGSGKIEKVTD